MALSDQLRAAVYARDKAICAFSGSSVWIPDYGTSLLVAHDWPDHIKPASRKGADSLSNLVCASYFYNRKKLNNGSDTSYLFFAGAPTPIFFWRIGQISAEQIDLLRSHAAICPADWYFNRALANINIAHQNRYFGYKAVRTSSYWISAAASKLTDWSRLGGINDFRRRGLIRYPKSPDVMLMLELAKCDFSTSQARLKRRVKDIYEQLYPYFKANSDALDAFISAEVAMERKRILRQAMDNKLVTLPTRQLLRGNTTAMKEWSGRTSINLPF